MESSFRVARSATNNLRGLPEPCARAVNRRRQVFTLRGLMFAEILILRLGESADVPISSHFVANVGLKRLVLLTLIHGDFVSISSVLRELQSILTRQSC